jgi:hypothetical protein
LDPVDLNNYDRNPGEFSLYIKPVDPYAYYFAFVPYSDKLKVRATNSENKELEVFYNEEAMSYIMGAYINYETEKYKFELYGSEKSACPNELLKTIYKEVPPFNEYSLYEFCENNNKSYICKTMKDTSNVSQKDFSEIVKNYKEENKFEEMSLPNKALYLIKRYYLFVLIPLVLITIYYVIKIRKYKKRVEEQ